MDLTEYQDVLSTKVLVYGPPKSGKTDLVGQLAEHFTLHWLDLEKGIRTLLNKERVPAEWLKNVKYFNIPDHTDYPIAIETVLEVLKGGLKKICFNHGKVGCMLCMKDATAKWSEVDITKFTPKDILVLDSSTQLGQSAINRAAKTGIQKLGADYKMQRDDFGEQGRALTIVFNKMQVLPINIAVIAHEIDTEKEDEKPERLAPTAGTRNFSKMWSKHFDEVVYCYVANSKHRVANSTIFRPGVQTGGRSGIKLDTMEVPSLVPIFDPSKAAEYIAKKASTK